ncbi:MAG: chromosome segregation protein SMC [Chthonomonas sp.]|nr:chromosome segregation protein SMC [Chthonomonas sp.]
MKLKRAKFFGFKTFADRTELEFDCDLIAVVGPNGCGKSNIVDAIMWGLGEPNARNLRANTSQEVIFAGSSTRKPLGYAEVILEFDNRDGSLNIDAETVEIGRRLSRSGDSEYTINRKNVRQKDVHDLLADSGLGRTGYAIVGQKDIDAALSASAVERRAWIDEAAGVQRYRLKRHESLRRLQAAQQSLDRVNDILREIDTQREPLREQAEVAIRYRAAVASLRDLEVGLLAKEFVESHTRLLELDAQMDSLAVIAAKETEQSAELRQKGKLLADTLHDNETRGDALRELQQSLLTAQARLEGQAKLIEQRLASLDELEANLDSEVADKADSMQSLLADVASSGSQVSELEAALLAAQAEVAGLGNLAELQGELAIAESLLAGARAAETVVTQYEVRTRLDQDRDHQIRREIAGINASLPDLNKEIERCETDLGELKAAENERELGRRVTQDLVRQLEQGRRKIEGDQREVLASIARVQGLKQALEHSIESMEGVAAGARAVLAAVESGLIEGQYDLVANVVSTDPDYVLALETALGASGSDLIVPHDSHAKRAIEFLKDRRMGRATFQPVNLMRPAFASQELRRVAQSRGVIGIASDLVDCAPEFRPVIDSLLGRILFCETLDDALALAKTAGWSRLVTLDGEVVFSSGAVTGGTAKSGGPGLVTKRQELADTELDLADLQAKLAKVEAKIAEIDAEIGRSEQGVEAPTHDTTEQRAEIENWLVSLRAERAEAERTLRRLEAEREGAGVALADADLLLAATRPEHEQRCDELKVRIAALGIEAEVARERLVECQTRLDTARDWAQEAARRLELAQSSHGTRDERRLKIAEQRAAATQEAGQNQNEQQRSIERLSDIASQLANLQGTRAEILQESFRLTELEKEARTSADKAETAIRDGQVDRVRQESRKAQAYQRLLEEHGLDEEAIHLAAAETELPDDAKSAVSRLRSEVRAMGTVNVGAIELYEQLTERYTTLHAQYDDVEASKLQIQEGIRELDGLTGDRFLAAFTQVQEHFGHFFAQLFVGGEAELMLTDPQNVLESGVEIEVTIPGKRRQRLELLSGGERALSACAFLFALLRVKPSPLVILDEVDAPLDGRNVERFVNALEEFKGISQFVLITHNPLTIEVAPMWFGVTMKEPGVTTVVPFRSAPALGQKSLA